MSTRYKVLALFAIGFFMLLTACEKALTPEQKAQLDALKQEQTSLGAEVEATRADDAKYSGGLIKGLIGMRLEILKTNQALIQQRIHALEGHATTSIEVNVTASDPVRAAALTKDIAEQRRKLADAQAEAAKYEGGLIKALAETSVATVGNTVAMLEQERLRATYGMAMPTAAKPKASAPQPRR
jgi:hypothetical protein